MAENPFIRVLEAMNLAKVDYVVVGGLAAVLHGVNRLTHDLDLVVNLVPQNATAAIDTLVSLGFRARIPADAHGFADADVRREWTESKNMLVFSMSSEAIGARSS